MTGGVLGNGVKVAFSLTSPTSWIRVGQLLDTGLSSLVRNKVDRTVHSTSPFRRSMPGMIEIGDLSLTILADFDEATTGALKQIYDLFVAGTTVWWREEIPVDRQQSSYQATEYQGYIVSFNREAPIDNRQQVTIAVAYDSDSYTRYKAGASAIT